MADEVQESGVQADRRRLGVLRPETDSVVVPRQLAGWVLQVLLADLGDRRRRRMGSIRDDILQLLDDLHATSVNGSITGSESRIVVADAVDSQSVVLLSVSRVAERLECSTRAVTNMLTSGRLRGTKDIDGRHWFVAEKDLDEYMNGKAA